jgi:uncharacterized protein (DUF885 family)
MEAWQASGMTQAVYCQSNGLNLKTFTYWRHRLKKQNSTTVQLVQLAAHKTVPVHHCQPSALRMIVDNHISIEIADEFSPATLARVLDVVQGR